MFGIGIENFGPNIGVITGRIAVCKDVIEVGRAIARRHDVEIEPGFGEK